jgi:hypothetical protein
MGSYETEATDTLPEDLCLADTVCLVVLLCVNACQSMAVV